MNDWLLLLPLGVLVLVTAPVFAWMHHVNEHGRRDSKGRCQRHR